MTNLLSILLINNNTATRTAITVMLARCQRPVEVCGSVGSLQEGLKYLSANSPPQVIILEVQSIVQGLKDVSVIQSICPQAMIMTTAAESHSDWILSLIRAGAGEYLTTPINPTELEDAIERAARKFDFKRSEAEAIGKIVTVYCPAGGMGGTSIAVNLAAVMVAGDEKTALADLNPLASDISTLLDLQPKYTLRSIVDSTDRIDSSFLTDLMARHETGIKVLCGPEEVGATAEITPDRMRCLLSLMQNLFNMTIVDAGGTFSEANVAIFNSSDLILFPLVLTLPAIKNAVRYLKALEYGGFGPDRVKVIVNRYQPKDDIKLADAEKILGVKAFHTIPNSYPEIKESIYKGTPLVTAYPRSPVSKAIGELADMVRNTLSGNLHQPQAATQDKTSQLAEIIDKKLFPFPFKRFMENLS